MDHYKPSTKHNRSAAAAACKCEAREMGWKHPKQDLPITAAWLAVWNPPEWWWHFSHLCRDVDHHKPSTKPCNEPSTKPCNNPSTDHSGDPYPSKDAPSLAAIPSSATLPPIQYQLHNTLLPQRVTNDCLGRGNSATFVLELKTVIYLGQWFFTWSTFLAYTNESYFTWLVGLWQNTHCKTYVAHDC